MQATTVSAVSPPSRPHHTEPHPVTLQALVADCLRSRGLSRRGTDHACRRRRGRCADPPTGVNCGNIAGLGRDIQRSSPTLNHSLPGGVTLSSQITVTRRRWVTRAPGGKLGQVLVKQEDQVVTVPGDLPA